jgi:hypothetical protein
MSLISFLPFTKTELMRDGTIFERGVWMKSRFFQIGLLSIAGCLGVALTAPTAEAKKVTSKKKDIISAGKSGKIYFLTKKSENIISVKECKTPRYGEMIRNPKAECTVESFTMNRDLFVERLTSWLIYEDSEALAIDLGVDQSKNAPNRPAQYTAAEGILDLCKTIEDPNAKKACAEFEKAFVEIKKRDRKDKFKAAARQMSEVIAEEILADNLTDRTSVQKLNESLSELLQTQGAFTEFVCDVELMKDDPEACSRGKKMLEKQFKEIRVAIENDGKKRQKLSKILKVIVGDSNLAKRNVVTWEIVWALGFKDVT